MIDANVPSAAAAMTPGRGTPVYLVQDSQILVAEDISAALRALGDCRVITVRRTDQIAPALQGVPRLDAAFLETALHDVLARNLDSLLGAHGARLILTVGAQDGAKARDRGWAILRRPFDDAMIRAALAT